MTMRDQQESPSAFIDVVGGLIAAILIPVAFVVLLGYCVMACI